MMTTHPIFLRKRTKKTRQHEPDKEENLSPLDFKERMLITAYRERQTRQRKNKTTAELPERRNLQ
jgi:hypothetical protein